LLGAFAARGIVHLCSDGQARLNQERLEGLPLPPAGNLKEMFERSTPPERQAAVDAAEMALALHSLQLYGLVEGGPEVDFDRCMELLELGRQFGVTPSPITRDGKP
jgi:hypothetical protein